MTTKRLPKSSRDILQRWNDRYAAIQHSTFRLGDSHEERQSRIRRALRDYNYFCRTYFPHLCTAECGQFQINAARYLAETPRARALYEWARGHAKSSHVCCLIPLWIKARAKAGLSQGFDYMILVSKSEDSAIALLGDLQAELSSNDAYRNDFDVKSDKGTEWQAGRFSIQDGTSFTALGRGQSPRGAKKYGRRPNFICIDDIDDDELVLNESRTRKIFDWMMSALFGTMAAGRGRFVMVGNRISHQSVLAMYAATPDIHHTVVNILDSQGRVTWAENYTLDEVVEMRRTMGERNFMKEHMNAPITEGSVFRRDWIHFGKILPLKQYRRIYAYTDPSWKSSKKNDYKATIVVGKTREGYYHILRAYAAQTTVKAMVAWHYDIDEVIGSKAHVRYWMESNLIQDLLLREFVNEGKLRGHQIAVTKDGRRKPDKFSRIEALQPLFERALILFNEAEKETPGMQTLVDQLLSIERGSKAHDDAPDALEGAIYRLDHGSSGAPNGNRYYVPPRTDRGY